MANFNTQRLPPFLRRIIRSISSVPALIALCFLGLAVLQLNTSSESAPHQLPRWLARFDLQDLDTIRTVLSSVIGGVFTLTVFAYTMVMSVINRSISNYSPRLLPLLIGKRYHQVVMGIGVGTIAHAALLLLGVAEKSPGIASPPVLAAASSVLFALASLGAYIYFINRVSLGIHINEVLRQSFEHTAQRIESVQALLPRLTSQSLDVTASSMHPVLRAEQSGYLAGLDLEGLAELSTVVGTPLQLIPAPGSFVHQGDVLLRACVRLSPKHESRADRLLEVSERVPLDVYETGFKHLVEVAVKAMSPALNDPGTALTALHYLRALFVRLRTLPHHQGLNAETGAGCLYFHRFSYEELRSECLTELHQYLDEDPWTRGLLARVEAEI